MKALVVVMVLARFASANTPSVLLPEPAITSIAGCWKSHDEQWMFTRDANHGVSVVRTIDPSHAEAKRAAIAQKVSFADAMYGFSAAGRIHGLMMVAQLQHGTLVAMVFSSHEPGQYFWTGNTLTLKRC